MPKDLTFNEDVRKKILSGMEKVNNAVGSTLGQILYSAVPEKIQIISHVFLDYILHHLKNKTFERTNSFLIR